MFQRTRPDGGDQFARRRLHAMWPVALAILVRLGAWALVPASRFASDEESYFQVSTALLTRGDQDLFWPPVTAWLISAIRLVLRTDSIVVIRLAWIGFDIGCVMMLRQLAIRLSPFLFQGDEANSRRFVTLVTASYALYLPAISYSQFLTSEIPALLQILAILLLVTRPAKGWLPIAAAGALAGTLVLTRPSLLPLLGLWPLAAMVSGLTSWTVKEALVFGLAGAALVGADVSANWWRAGELTMARNSAYNLYIGNRDMYGEDLDLLHPAATPEQIEFRRQMWTGELHYPTESAQALQREALEWIAAHPRVFIRRAIGRLARVFAPRTDVLELVGGERGVGIFSLKALVLLAIANTQWTVVLFGGVLGLLQIRRATPDWGLLLATTIAGSLLLCLIAISKPRYSFVFDPVLILGATAFMSSPREAVAGLTRRARWGVAAAFAFLAWGWVAWLIFSISSRAAL